MTARGYRILFSKSVLKCTVAMAVQLCEFSKNPEFMCELYLKKTMF